MEKKREVWLDVLRAFACMCVVLVHSSAKYDGHIPGQYILAPANYILMAWGVGLFYALSGALLLSKPVSLSQFYRKRFGRLAFPIILWSIIYIIYEGWLDGNLTWSLFFEKVSMIPFTAQTPLLWFMYTLLGIYLITPVFSSFLVNAKKRDVEILLIVWGLTLLVPYFKIWNPNVGAVLDENGILQNFTGFLWYAVFGFYLRKYVNWKITSWKFILLVVVSFVYPLLVHFLDIFPVDVLNTQMSISSVAMTAIPFIFFKNFSFDDMRPNNLVLLFAKYSFGIYLFHWVLLRPLKPFLTQFHIHYAIQIPVTAIVVSMISLAAVYLISRLPFNKYIIG